MLDDGCIFMKILCRNTQAPYSAYRFWMTQHGFSISYRGFQFDSQWLLVFHFLVVLAVIQQNENKAFGSYNMSKSGWCDDLSQNFCSYFTMIPLILQSRLPLLGRLPQLAFEVLLHRVLWMCVCGICMEVTLTTQDDPFQIQFQILCSKYSEQLHEVPMW